MVQLTLVRDNNPLASAQEQRRILESPTGVINFAAQLAVHQMSGLNALGLETLQVNLGRICNQTCNHCHVDAGPDRRETMSQDVAQACLNFLAQGGFKTLDITGGAPEMNAVFRHLVTSAKAMGKHVIDRCNLTILEAPGYEDLADFLAAHQVEVIASLPCYLEENVDRQRGDRVFQRSIAALQKLNMLGYGKAEQSELKLSLVYNPQGLGLPPSQEKLEQDYKRELAARYGIQFTKLFTITNLPISRFLDDLLKRGKYAEYMEKLCTAFNPGTVNGLMCRTMISVDYLGFVYDCDFNQMLEMKLGHGRPINLLNITEAELTYLKTRMISTGNHCYGCTAGAGSSCGGAIT